MRTFESGATRDSDENKIDFEGFIAPRVLERYGQYMHEHRKQADGALRDSDNWQKGIPIGQYMKSFVRHAMELWKLWRGNGAPDRKEFEDLLCAILFNVMGLLFEYLKSNDDVVDAEMPPAEALAGHWTMWGAGHGTVSPVPSGTKVEFTMAGITGTHFSLSDSLDWSTDKVPSGAVITSYRLAGK